MKRLFIIIDTDSEEELEVIKKDIEMELSCCWNTFTLRDIYEVLFDEEDL